MKKVLLLTSALTLFASQALAQTSNTPSAGKNNTPAPTYSTQIGIQDGSGKIQAVSSTNPVPVTGTGLGGNVSNAATPQATTSTNLGAVSYCFAYNTGTSQWAPCPTDTSQYQYIDIGAAFVGLPISQTTPGSSNGLNINPSSSANIAATTVVSSALENSHVCKASSGNRWIVAVTYTSAFQGGFIEIENATSKPSDGSVTPIDFSYAPPGPGTVTMDEGVIPENNATGITAVLSSSTTPFTQTTSGSAAGAFKCKQG